MEAQPKNLVRCSFVYKCGKCGESVGVFIMTEAGHSRHEGLCLCGAGTTFKVFLDGGGRTELSTVEVERTWQATPEQVEQAKQRIKMQERMKNAKDTLGNPFEMLFQAMSNGTDTSKLKFKKQSEPAVIAMADALHKETKGETLPEPEMERVAEKVWNQASPMEQLAATVAYSLEGKKGADIVLAGYQAHKENGRW